VGSTKEEPQSFLIERPFLTLPPEDCLLLLLPPPPPPNKILDRRFRQLPLSTSSDGHDVGRGGLPGVSMAGGISGEKQKKMKYYLG